MIDLEKATALVAKHEGYRAIAYRDSRGFLTIGYGTNLDAEDAADHCAEAGLDYDALRGGRAITEAQAQQLLAKAVRYTAHIALITVVGVYDMPEPAQLVVVDMMYNMGRAGFLEFKRLIAALEAHDWRKAVNEMRQSKWYGEVGTRALEDIALLLSALQPIGG